jgi:hypothetical protein
MSLVPDAVARSITVIGPSRSGPEAFMLAACAAMSRRTRISARVSRRDPPPSVATITGEPVRTFASISSSGCGNHMLWAGVARARATKA